LESYVPLQLEAMPNNHLQPHRGWALIRDGGALTQVEFTHLEHCQRCNDWLVTFVNLARKTGFHISFEIPAYNPPPRQAA
jgi:hypothetical protein